MPEPVVSENLARSQDVGYFQPGVGSGHFLGSEEPLDINLRNLQTLSLMDNMGSTGLSSLTAGMDNNENLVYFHDSESNLHPYIDDPKEGNISRTVRVPSSEHVAEIVGRQGCKIKDLRARTNTYIKTPMRTQSPVFVVTGKEEAVLHVMEEIQNAAEHFTHIRASRNQHKALGGLEASKSASREGDVMIQVVVPYRVVGLVVGLKGQTIKAIQHDTDTFIVTPNRDKAPIFEIRGQPENVERAKMMILRHIENRTRHCRLQDTTNLPSSWSDEHRQNGNDYSSYYQNEASTPNGLGSSGSASAHSNFSGNSGSGPSLSPQASCFNMFSSSPPAAPNQNWRSYGNILDQLPPPSSSFTPWSIASSDNNPSFNTSPSPVNIRAKNVMNSTRSAGAFQYSMSLGSNSSSNSSSGMSPQDLTGEVCRHHSSLNTFGTVNGSLRGMTDLTEPSAFTSLPQLAPVASKNSLVLGKLFQANQGSEASSLRGMNFNSSTMDHLVNGLARLNGGLHEDLNCFTTGAMKCSPLASFPGGLVGEASLYHASQMNGFLSGNSSPTSKSCSLSDTSGSQSSPTPRLCKVCEEADVVAALVPCGHNLFCMECAEGIVNKPAESERKCPACKDVAADVLRIRA